MVWPLTPSLLPASAPRRLTFHSNGTLTEPGGKRILLRGFTFDYKRGPHGGHSQKNVTDEDRQVSTLLPNTNFARLVMVHWHDEPTRHHGDCASDDPALGFLNQPCLDQFDRIIKWAAKHMWVTITARASLAAGDGGPGRTIFNNATLRKQMVSMWGFLARRYAGHDHIAGYEVMSEPRVDDASAVHAFHLTACHHVWKADPAAGCFVGPTKFYDRTHLSSAYLIADARVVYAANMFDYVEGTDAGEVRAALLRKLGMISNFSTTFSVPVWVDQWGVQDDSPGGEVAHATYLREILQIFGEARFHWSYWIWRHQCDCPGGYPVTCELPNGSHVFEQTKLHAFARYIGPSPAPELPYKPIKPCPYKPESLDKCVAEAKAMCEDAMSAGYEACKKCVWEDRGELIYDDCSWKRRHGKIVEHVCGPEPGQHTTVEECVDVEGEITYDDEKTFPQEEHFPDDDEAFDDDDWL